MQGQVPLELSCIAVLPATASAGDDNTLVYAEAQSLEEGAEHATAVLKNELQGKPGVQVINSNQLAALGPEITGGRTGTVTAIGKKLNCGGVLITTVNQYQRREGTEYSVDSPASVEFSMVLRYSKNGIVLWTTDFREKQQSFLSNIFTFSKAKKRGFKWVSAEQLLEQGIKQRLSECPYLK